RFEEDDNRSRTSKQLCHRDPGTTMVGTAPTGGKNNPWYDLLLPATFSQACLPGSLYDNGAYDTPNGLALPFVYAPLAIGSACGQGCSAFGNIGLLPDGNITSFLRLEDPYGGLTQSRDLRTIASI